MVIAKFQGFLIRKDDVGYYWSHGGYFETLAECKADISAYNVDLRSDENVYGLASVQQSLVSA